MGIEDDFGDFESAVQDAANRGVSEAQDFISGLSPEQSVAFQAQQEAQQAAQQAAEQAQADALWDSLINRYPNARNFGSRGTGNTFLDFLVKAAGGEAALLGPANVFGDPTKSTLQLAPEQPPPPAVPTPSVTKEGIPGTVSTSLPTYFPDLESYASQERASETTNPIADMEIANAIVDSRAAPAPAPLSPQEKINKQVEDAAKNRPGADLYWDLDTFSKYPGQFSGPNAPPVPDVAPFDDRGVFTNQAMRDQAKAQAAINEVNKIDPSKTLTGDEAQLAAYRTMGYTPEMAAGWPAARNTAGDTVAGILQGIIPGGGIAEVVSPETTKGFRGGIAEGINNLFGTHAPERNPWDMSDPTRTFANPNMDRQTFVDLAADIPSTTSGFRGSTVSDLDPDSWESGGNIEAIRRFLQDPNYGNIPEVDPVSALAAYQNAIGGIDALVGERGFTDRGYAQAARDRTQGIFDEFQAGQDFDSMLNDKIGRAFADEALFNKDIELRGQGVQAVEQSFPQGFASDIFDPDAFSKAAENIYGEKLRGAQDIIGRAGSRGQLSPTGGRLASESLLSQGPDVQSRLTDILGGVRSEAEGGFGGIRGSALEAAQGYKLGDELFDITPFESQAGDYLSTTIGELPGRITSAVGTDPLFSAVSALQEGGRQQGQVSGTPSFLDVLAEREGGVGTGRDKRGLGSRGSGVF